MRVVSRWMRVMFASGVLAAALAAVLAPSAPAGVTGHGRDAIACPQVAGQPVCCGPPVMGVRADAVPCCLAVAIPGCCGPIVGPNCCLPAQCAAPALSIAASPNPANEGHQAMITGTLTGGTVAAQPVDLYEKLAGQAAFANVAHTKTDTSGAFAFARAVSTNAQWYAMAGSVQSSTMAESVLASVLLYPSSIRPRAGAKVKLSGTIAPSHAGERVALQRLRRGHWLTIARPRLDAHSHFAVRRKMRGGSVARFRVVLAAGALNAQSFSAVVAIRAR